MDAERKLQDIFVDAKVPRPLRDIVPVIESPSGIVWVAGFRLSERAKITAATRYVLHLTAVPLSTEAQSLLRAR
jgi:tRNA(Ile)-lysidine synthase